MVQIHKMIASFEQLTYDDQMLRNAWKEQIEGFKLLVNGGWTRTEIVDFITYVSNTNWASLLFPGSSLGTLLISKPHNGKLNYQQTLAIRYDDILDLFKMQYSDYDTIDSKKEWKNAILWSKECKGIDLIKNFNEFLKWNKKWG